MSKRNSEYQRQHKKPVDNLEQGENRVPSNPWAWSTGPDSLNIRPYSQALQKPVQRSTVNCTLRDRVIDSSALQRALMAIAPPKARRYQVNKNKKPKRVKTLRTKQNAKRTAQRRTR